MKEGGKWAELVQLMHKVASEFFVTNAPDPPYWAPNSCFGAFQTISLLHKSWCKIGRAWTINAPVRVTKLRWNFRNERTRSTLMDPKLLFWDVLDRFVTARKSVQKWPNCCNWCTRSCNEVALKIFATNPPDPPHWTPNSYFRAFRTILLLHEVWCKTGQTTAINAQVRATKSCQNISQWMYLMHPIGPQTHVLWRLRLFRWGMNFSANWVELLPLMHKFVQQSRVRIFLQQTHPIHPIGPQT
jgi:hypothetical protein